MAHTTRAFRVFVSSTFSDLRQERNALQRQVFPRLRELCLRHGCRFQDVDLRWGVREEAALDQQTMTICLDEVRRSQRVSPRPNFIVLLGDRYGWRPLPSEIPAQEFARIEQHAAGHESSELLATWYRRDDNAVPPVYCLQPRRDRFAEFQAWEREVEQPLRSLLLGATAGMDLTDDERLKYGASATEQEIAAGAMRVADAREHVFCFFRTTTGFPSDPRSAAEYLDLDGDGRTDRDAARRLGLLKERLESRLPGNVHRVEAGWSGDGMTSDHLGTLPADLDGCLRLLEDEGVGQGLCVMVWKCLAPVILAEIARLERVDALRMETSEHEAFVASRAEDFVGRTTQLEAIASYLAGSERQPFAVVGEAGVGKSALMARAVQRARDRHPQAGVLVRFIGVTPASSDGRALLESICRQVSRCYGADEGTVPTGYKELVEDLPRRLALATAQKPLMLFLDALDQLADAARARDLNWMPVELPVHVRLVVSTLPGVCADAVERKVPPSQQMKLEPMSPEAGRELLDLWLAGVDRTLQPEQKGGVLRRFGANGLPLFLKLAFEEVRRWRSYSGAMGLCGDVPGMIRALIGRLSSDAGHGRMLVNRSLGYIAAGRNGLGEDELLDVLSRDEEVLRDFKERARHAPPEARLPVVIWSRLFFDLEPYLTARSADGASLLDFYHRQLREVVEADFLADGEGTARHASLAGYFAGQDLIHKDSKTPNLRKLSELPYQQTLGAQWEQLHATLTDFDFLEAKCTHVAVATSGAGEAARTVHGGVYELQEDYRRALEMLPTGGGEKRSGAPLIVTAVDSGGGLMVRCPFCNRAHPVRDEWLGREIECPSQHCRGLLRVNSFVVRCSR